MQVKWIRYRALPLIPPPRIAINDKKENKFTGVNFMSYHVRTREYGIFSR